MSTKSFGGSRDKSVPAALICPKLDSVELPIKFFKVDGEHQKMYVCGSNDLLVVLDLSNGNEVRQLELNSSPGITDRVFCLDEKNDTVIEGSSTFDKGYLSVLGSPHDAITFDCPIVSLDSAATSKGNSGQSPILFHPDQRYGYENAVTDVLVLLSNGNLELLQILDDKQIKVYDTPGIRTWNYSPTNRASMAIIYQPHSMAVVDDKGGIWFVHCDEIGARSHIHDEYVVKIDDPPPPVTASNTEPRFFNLRYPFYIQPLTLGEIYVLRVLMPNRYHLEPTFNTKVSSIASEKKFVAFGHVDGSIELHDLTYLLPDNRYFGVRYRHLYEGASPETVIEVQFYEDSIVAAGDVVLDLVVDSSDKKNRNAKVYAIGSDLAIKMYFTKVP